MLSNSSFIIFSVVTAISLLLKPFQPLENDLSVLPSSKLFSPIKIGDLTLKHRVVLAPLTRYRSTKKDHVPVLPRMKTYYTQRASRPGTLLITEATFISPKAGGYDNVPGIWSEAQIAAWKEITDSVHATGSYIYLQLWALGRAAKYNILKEDGYEHVSASPIAIDEKHGTPRELSIAEIQQYIEEYAQAARNAVHGAGFDGVEVHCANGYLPDQFLQDVSNNRTDGYGGSVERRSRFATEVVDAVVKAVGEEKTGVRISPWSTYQSMKMADPVPQFTHFVNKILASHPNLAYMHAIEPEEDVKGSNDFIRDIWAPKPLITAGNYVRDTGIARADEKGDVIAFGRFFISNPDIVNRLEKDIPLTPYDVATFYVGGEVGYIDYPFATEIEGEVKAR